MGAFFSTFVRLAFVMVAIVASAVPARAGIIVSGTEQEHLDFAGDPMFQSVGWLLGVDSSGNEFIAGSGASISGQWGVTMAHVLDNGWSSLAFSLDPNARDLSAALYTIDSVYIHPGFVDDNGLGTSDDIALFHLSVPIVGVTPAVIYTGALTPGTHAYWSGYGALGYYPSGETDQYGMKMGGENMVDSIGSTALGVDSQFFLADWGPAHSTPLLSLEMGGTNGDSGGGWFADIDGQMQLIGLTAFSRGQFSNTGVIRPCVYQEWINETTAVPEPSSIFMILSTFPMLWAVRRRRLFV